MNKYEYTISLRLRHPSMNPAEITAALGLGPFRCWRAGEPRSTPTGAPLEGRWPDTYWTSGRLADGQWRGKALPSAVCALLDQIATHKDFFQQVRAEGGKVELFVGWYFDGNSGDILDFELMGRLAALKIDLSLDIYPPELALDDSAPLTDDQRIST